MQDWTWLVLGGIGGTLLGGAAVLAWAASRTGALRARIASLEPLTGDLATQRARAEAAEREAARREEQVAQLETRFEEQRALLETAEKRLGSVFAQHGQAALKENRESFMALAKQTFAGLMTEAKGDAEARSKAVEQLVKPVRELLEKHQATVTEIEKRRESAYAGLQEQIKQIASAHEQLGTETRRLVTALRRSEHRGRWGELQLRNVVELAGMTEHCDFREQVQTDDPTTRDRPDMVVSLPGGGVIVVDSKVAIDAYLDALEGDADEAVREAAMVRHAEQVEKHAKGLARKAYWSQFAHTPQLVVMFMPLEPALLAAVQRKPDLHARMMEEHVLIATPTLLVALLRAIAYGWQQEAVAENAREIHDAGRELYDRLGTFARHLEGVGKHLSKAGEAYNKSVSSLESRVLPSARRMEELKVVERGTRTESPPLVEVDPKPLTSAELLEAGGDRGDGSDEDGTGDESRRLD